MLLDKERHGINLGSRISLFLQDFWYDLSTLRRMVAGCLALADVVKQRRPEKQFPIFESSVKFFVKRVCARFVGSPEFFDGLNSP